MFSDLSVYKPNQWNIYSDIKEKLIGLGIPANEIQFIQTAKTEKARKRMIEDMNNGTIRVLFGSTSMLGTGVNAQKRAVAVLFTVPLTITLLPLALPEVLPSPSA